MWQVIETFAVQTGEHAPPRFVPGGLDCARTAGVRCDCRSVATGCIWEWDTSKAPVRNKARRRDAPAPLRARMTHPAS